MTVFHPDEVVANLVAYGMLEQVFERVESMLAHGPNPPTPAGQKRVLAQLAAVRERLREGKVRPALTRYLTAADKLARFEDPNVRHQIISGAPDLPAVGRYYEDMAKLEEKK